MLRTCRLPVRSFVVRGSGNIVKRHVHAIQVVAPDAKIRVIGGRSEYGSVRGIITALRRELAASDPAETICLIASPASLHVEELAIADTFGVRCLVEKPLSIANSSCFEGLQRTDHAVAYNMRFLSAVEWLRRRIKIHRSQIQFVEFHVFDDFRGWRDRHYKDSVSANKSLGGGALLELSHEIDLATWLFDVKGVGVATTGSAIGLNLDVETSAELELHESAGFPILVRQNMLRRRRSRGVIVSLLDEEWIVDLLTGSVLCNRRRHYPKLKNFANNIGSTYEAQLRHFLDFSELNCTLQQASRVVALCDYGKAFDVRLVSV